MEHLGWIGHKSRFCSFRWEQELSPDWLLRKQGGAAGSKGPVSLQMPERSCCVPSLLQAIYACILYTTVRHEHHFILTGRNSFSAHMFPCPHSVRCPGVDTQMTHCPCSKKPMWTNWPFLFKITSYKVVRHHLLITHTSFHSNDSATLPTNIF